MTTNTLVTHGHFDMAQTLNRQELEIVQATYSTKIAKIDDDTMFRSVLQTVNRSYVELGQVPPGDDEQERKQYMKQFTELILLDIKRYYSHISPEEVAIAISRGIRNEYGKYYGFNVVSIHTFIALYLESAERFHAMQKQKLYNENMEKQTKPPSVEREYIFLAQGCLDAHQLFKKIDRVTDYNSVKFNFLYKLGIILYTEEEYKALEMQATLDLKREVFQKSNSIVTSIKDLGKSLSENKVSFDYDVKSRVNNMLLVDFFKLITTEELLETLNCEDIKQQFITLKNEQNVAEN